MTWLSCTSIGAVTTYGLRFADVDPAELLTPRDRTGPHNVDRFRVPEFDVRERLGRRGSSTLDRNGALALMAATECLDGVAVDPSRTGVIVGTTVGSFSSTSNFSALTMTEDKPYNVPPSLFPNTVMNSAAGLTAIRFGLTGPNTTIAGGDRAGLKSVRYLATLMAAGYLDAALLICVEEDSPHRRAFHQLRGQPDCGEGAVALLLVPGTVPDRRLRLRLSDDAPLGPDDDACVVAGGDPSGENRPLFVRDIFGSVGAATFGCQVLTATALLGRGPVSLLLSDPGVASTAAPRVACEVAA